MLLSVSLDYPVVRGSSYCCGLVSCGVVIVQTAPGFV